MLPFFHYIHMNALMYFANFEFNEEWQGDQILKKLENIIIVCNYTNCTMSSQG
jgi:ATP-dependent protease HslVU (ClpYQ) peptidase subunit